MAAEPTHFTDLRRIRKAERGLPAPFSTPMHVPDAVFTAGPVEIAQRLLQTVRRGFGEPAFGLLCFGELATLAGETRPICAILCSTSVELRRRSALVERRIPHCAANAANPLGIANLLGVQLKSVAAPKQHQTRSCFSAYGLIAASGAPPVDATKYAFADR